MPSVTLPRTSTGSAPSARELARSLLGRAVVAEIPDRDPLGAVAREAQRDRAPDPARAARDEDGHGSDAASGASAGADDGISSQPRRVGDSRGPSSAFDEA